MATPPKNHEQYVLEPLEEASSKDDAGSSQHKSEFGRQGVLGILGAFTFMIPSYGFMQSLGSVQSYLQLNQLDQYGIGDVGWIAGMYMFLSYFLNIQIGPVCDHYGSMAVGSVGLIITAASFFLLAECKEYWQFMLCLGVFGAFGGALLGTLGMCIVAKLFIRRRALAMGIVLAGSSVGAIVFTIVLRSTLPNWGWQWSMRIIGFVILAITGPGLFCLYPSRFVLGADHGPRKHTRAVLNFSAFRLPSFFFASIGQFLLEFAVFSVAGLLPTIAIDAGFSPEDGYLLTSIVSVGAIFGRVLPGLFGDMIGPFNMLLIMCVFTVLFMGTLFVPFAGNSMSILCTFSALWGLGSASFLSITPVCVGKLCHDKDFGRFIGTQTFLVSFSVLLCVPLSGTLLDSMGAQALAGFLTGIVVLGAIFYLVSRSLVIGSWHSPTTRI